MSAKKINIDAINIGLMFLALIPAMLLPFELFLFVYAFLGPLHYLTEINWLHKKNYFTTQKYDYMLLLVLIAIISLLVFTHTTYKNYISFFYFFAFAAAFSMVIYNNYIKKILLTLVLLAVGSVFFYFFNDSFKTAFTILLPSLIHVFIFTGAFIILGSLKSKSKLGIVSTVVFVICALITLFASPRTGLTHVDAEVYNMYGIFRPINEVLVRLFSFMQVDNAKIAIWAPAGISERDMEIFFSGTGIKVMRFIAFAYTYHYFNWFSKTSVIQWHNTKRINMILIVLIWIISIVLYAKDYMLGLKWLFVLSLAHVILEFPLNNRSFLEIKQQLTAKFSK
ncbi:hypothetical protein [Flavobacterium suzhouense]|uniref:Uncharacterized protein n=1 Tax=Flavobacterium suzhouense TaxID=1529638 RepID=A0ABW5NS73_9FLAO